MIEFKKWYFRIYLFFVRILIVSMIIGISFPVHVFGTTELKQLYALSAVLMDADSGRILFSKNGQEERAMASTTKIMTAILALEMGNMDDTVTATYDALKSITLEDSHMGILTGEELTKVTGQFLDYAEITGTNVVGSVQNVTKIMNKWGVEATDVESVLDKLAYAGQISGISVDSLSSTLITGNGIVSR